MPGQCGQRIPSIKTEGVTLVKLEHMVVEEFPEDQGKIKDWFRRKDYQSLYNFLEENKYFNFSSRVVINAIDKGMIVELRKEAQAKIAKESRIEKLSEVCAQLLGKQAKAFS